MKIRNEGAIPRWAAHPDLGQKRTLERQNVAAVMLVEAGRGRLLAARDGQFRLPSSVCQLHAQTLRERFERGTFEVLSKLAVLGANLVKVTVIETLWTA